MQYLRHIKNLMTAARSQSRRSFNFYLYIITIFLPASAQGAKYYPASVKDAHWKQKLFYLFFSW